MTQVFGAEDLRRAIATALTALRHHQAEIDRVNVYPVADSDTGTNLVLTMTAAAGALTSDDPFDAVPKAAMIGARGNSGIILAEILHGLLGAAKDGDAGQILEGLRVSADRAYQAVLEPVEGTMLSVARAAALHAVGDLPGHVFESAARAAGLALQHTSEQLPVLKDAGVVDAGGMGLWVVLDAFAAATTGRKTATLPSSHGESRIGYRETGSPVYRFEVQFLLDAPDEAIPSLKQALGAIGDSVVVSGGDGTWNVHVHTNDTTQAVAIGNAAGTARSPTITAFTDGTRSAGRAVPLSRPVSPVGVVAFADGDGFAHLFSELGAGAIVRDDPQTLSGAGQLRDAVATIGTHDVIVLTNGAHVDHAIAFEPEQRVEIVQTRDMAHGITTMLAFGDARDLEHNVEQMRQAADVASTAAITVRDGIVGAFIDGEPVPASGDALEALLSLAGMLDEEGACEVMTVFAGVDAPAGERSEIEKRLREAFPGVDVDVREGGQSGSRYLLAVE